MVGYESDDDDDDDGGDGDGVVMMMIPPNLYMKSGDLTTIHFQNLLSFGSVPGGSFAT